MRYQEHLHTPEALAQEISGLYQKAPDLILLGSLGRAVIFNCLLQNPYLEFEARGQSPEKKIEEDIVMARDIDPIGAQLHNVADSEPFEVDITAFDSPRLRITQQGADWFLISDKRGVYEPLHPAVMEPIQGETVYGATAVTVPFQTHQAVFGIKDDMRPKDVDNYNFLRTNEKHNRQPLPLELYEPFDKLRALVNSGWLQCGRRIYRATVPNYLRQKAYPLTSRIKDKLA
jgi:hypothetical protein